MFRGEGKGKGLKGGIFFFYIRKNLIGKEGTEGY